MSWGEFRVWLCWGVPLCVAGALIAAALRGHFIKGFDWLELGLVGLGIAISRYIAFRRARNNPRL